MIKRTAKRMRLCVTCLILILAFIWGNSLLPGSDSGILSDTIKALLQKFFPFLFSGDGSGGGWVRKVAHFSEFTLLSICLCWLFAMFRGRLAELILPVLLSGILTACIDEFIQLFVPGRNSSFIDVGIDSTGVIVGIALFTIGFLIAVNMNQHHLEELK